MRVGAWGAALLVLSGCSPIDASKAGADAAPVAGLAARAQAGSVFNGADYDYLYAFRLPAARIAKLQDSHIRGCDQLGTARCRVTAVRYHVADDNSVAAVLALQLDPALARGFGRAATAVATSTGGLLVDAQVASGAGAGHGSGIVARLRAETASIDASLKNATSDDQRRAALDKQARLRAAIATIGEVDQAATQSAATTPMLITYSSGNAVPVLGGSASATFDNAGETFLQSLASLTQVLAGIGPWLLLLLGGALLLRRVVNPEPAAEERAIGVPLPPEDTNRNVIQRWFSREPQHDEHPENVN
ncbi:MAG: hypothetical protein B7Y45_08815 [Sphingomonas sp. 28-66-16]|nr:MAG: hypothetical protein B7Y45_08815 [Sphingomonas sp. 28-66-16]